MKNSENSMKSIEFHENFTFSRCTRFLDWNCSTKTYNLPRARRRKWKLNIFSTRFSPSLFFQLFLTSSPFLPSLFLGKSPSAVCAFPLRLCALGDLQWTADQVSVGDFMTTNRIFISNIVQFQQKHSKERWVTKICLNFCTLRLLTIVWMRRRWRIREFKWKLHVFMYNIILG